MSSLDLDLSARSLQWQQIELELLGQLRKAEAEFKQAPEETREEAGQRYRVALDQFSHLVLDRRFPARTGSRH